MVYVIQTDIVFLQSVHLDSVVDAIRANELCEII